MVGLLISGIGYQVQAQPLDFGDAPDSYGTLLNSNGARHKDSGKLCFGTNAYRDTESDGQPNSTADGDDTNNIADEGELGNFPALFPSQSSYSITVYVYNTSGSDATISGWIDFNKNGVFDANERTQAVVPSPFSYLGSGLPIKLTWSGLSELTTGLTYMRLRTANNAAEVENPTGLANTGEVEDYSLTIQEPRYDFGDAPDSYGTLLSSNGPRHLIDSPLTRWPMYGFMGNGVGFGYGADVETDGQPSSMADGDSTKGGYLYVGFGQSSFYNDEDGRGKFPPLSVSTTSYSIYMRVYNTTVYNSIVYNSPSMPDATVSAWIDFNRNGVFEPNERTQALVPYLYNGGALQGDPYVTLTWNGLSGLSEGVTYVRLRIATNAAEVENPTGPASDGEVEDYRLTIGTAALPVELVSFNGQWIKNKGNYLNWTTSWEKGNDHFEIQRSNDAMSFETIGQVSGRGTTVTKQSYEYTDVQGGHFSYYRLKQVDLDGKVSCSRVISIRQDSGDLSLSVYPNPATEQLRLQLINKQEISRIRVYTISGKQVINQTGSFDLVDIRSLSAGVYMVEVTTTAGYTLHQRFVKL